MDLMFWYQSTYPVVITYPRTGAAWVCLGLLHDKVIDREVNPVTIGLPGGLGTSASENVGIKILSVTQKKYFKIL